MRQLAESLVENLPTISEVELFAKPGNQTHVEQQDGKQIGKATNAFPKVVDPTML